MKFTRICPYAAVGTVGNAMNHDYRLPAKYAGDVMVDLPLFAGGAYLARQHEAELKAQIADANARYDELIHRAILDYQTGVLR